MISFLGKERRKRIMPPATLVILGWIILLFPVINYFQLAFATGYNWRFPTFMLMPGLRWSIPAMIVAPVAGLGLLRIKKWGWFAFIVFAICTLAYNTAALILMPDARNTGALLSIAFGLGSAFYFCRKDIAAPYFKMYPRGWRYEKRYPVQVNLSVNNSIFQTADLSLSGFYIHMASDRLKIGQTESIELNGLKLDASIVRLDENGAGFAFRNLRKNDREQLKELLHAVAQDYS